MIRQPPDVEPVEYVKGDDGVWRPRGHAPSPTRTERRVDWLSGLLAGILIGLVIGAATRARAEPVAGPIRVIDGDTVELLRSGEIIRLYNIDAPEARPCAGGTHGGAPSSCARCPAELALAARAGARLAAMLEGQPVAIHRCEPSGRCKDRYGRTLARLEAAGRDVGEALINEGLATRWPERGNWCGRE